MIAIWDDQNLSKFVQDKLDEIIVGKKTMKQTAKHTFLAKILADEFISKKHYYKINKEIECFLYYSF